jgi:hypothetical protein
MGLYNILYKVDRAIAAYLIADGAGTEDDTFPAKRAGDVPNPPYTAVFSDSGRRKFQGGSEYVVKTQVNIFTNAAPDVGENTEDMADDSGERVQNVFDAFNLEADDQGGHALADAITNTARTLGGDMADFTVTDVTVGEIEQGAGKDGQWVDTINMELLCTPHNVSD